MTTYKQTKEMVLTVNFRIHYANIFQVWEKFAKVPYYECYIDGQRALQRYFKIQKRDVINYIERYL